MDDTERCGTSGDGMRVNGMKVALGRIEST